MPQPHKNASGRMPFLDRIRRTPLVFDGAMGTMLYQRGIFLNACYDELCLNRPELLVDIHREYIDAGAEVIETNTFGANRVKLAPYGLADRVEDINRAGVALARQAADGAAVYIAASAGPCLPEDGASSITRNEAQQAYDEQFAVFAAENVDLLVLETFYDLDQLQLAARVARKWNLVTLASFALHPAALNAENENLPGRKAAQRLDADPNVDVIGMNCGLGPAEWFHPVQHVLAATGKPVVIMPNAGGPREVGGRMLYLNSPEYFTEFCKRFIELGVRGVGGCCGATPAHIRMAARAVKTLSGVKEHLSVRVPERKSAAGTAPGIAEKSPFGAKLFARQPVTSVELLPPMSAAGLPAFLEKCRRCRAAGVDAVNLPDGPRASARMSVLATAFRMAQELGIEPIPHYCCRDRNLIGMQSDLIGGCALGLRTWLLITGDPPKLGNYPDATGVFDLDSIGLVQLASNLNRGLDAAGQPVGDPAHMLIGVGANPAAIDLDREIDRFFRKIDAGAEFAITQPVFDADTLLRFMELTGRYERRIPVIAGLYPLLSFKNAQFMSRHVPGVVVPGRILESMSQCHDKETAAARGVAIAREIRAKVAGAVAGFQTSAPLGRMDIALAVLAAD